MFAPLLDAVRADIDRQVGWARDEIRRQIRYAAFIGVIAGMGALAALGTLIDGTHRPSLLAYAAGRFIRCARHDRRRFVVADADSTPRGFLSATPRG